MTHRRRRRDAEQADTEITILGRRVRVRAAVPLLDALEPLAPERMATGRFCRNHECGNSRFYYRLPGDPQERKARACRFEVVPGMEITVLSAELKFVLRELLAGHESSNVDDA